MLKIRACVFCNCTDVEPRQVDFPIGNGKVLKIDGAVCAGCGEVYYDMNQLSAIEKMHKSINNEQAADYALQ
mgnify:CR=1 FL=1